MTRNFKILSTIMITIAILAGCGNHEDNNDSNKSKKEEVNQHSSKAVSYTHLRAHET